MAWERLLVEWRTMTESMSRGEARRNTSGCDTPDRARSHGGREASFPQRLAVPLPPPLHQAEEMTKPGVLLSLVTDENDYQREQASAAKAAASQAGFDLRVIYAGSDAITQA